MVQDRQGKRHLGKTVDELAHDVAALVAKEQARQSLDLKVCAQFGVAQALQHGLRHIPGIALQIDKRNPQIKVLHQAQQRGMDRVARGVVGTVSG